MTKQEKKVHDKVMMLGKFYEEFDREPKSAEEYNGVKIGRFMHNIRQKKVKINEVDKKYLEQLGISLQPKEISAQVHKKVLLLAKYYEEFNHVPKLKDEYEGIKIGNFLNNVRTYNTRITKEDRTYLQNLGIKL